MKRAKKEERGCVYERAEGIAGGVRALQHAERPGDVVRMWTTAGPARSTGSEKSGNSRAITGGATRASAADTGMAATTGSTPTNVSISARTDRSMAGSDGRVEVKKSRYGHARAMAGYPKTH